MLMLAFGFIPGILLGQQAEMRGKILDNETKEPISYCIVSLKNTSTGTCSNNDGEFIFHYPDSLNQCEVTISCIGYLSQHIKLDSKNSNAITTIYLTPELYQLSEINIAPNPMSAEDIVRQVIRNMHKNYQRSPYYMEGFLRDKVYNLYDNKTTRLTEAAIAIEKKEFGDENNADKVKVLEIRNSYNYSELGSPVKEKLRQLFWGYSNKNPLYSTLQSYDYTNSSSLRILLRNELNCTNFSGNTMFDGNPVKIIDIKEEYIKFLFQKIKAKNAYRLIRLYIDMDNYAILKSELYFIIHTPKDSIENQGLHLQFKQDTIMRMAVKQYEKIGGKYYLKYATNFGKIHDQPDESEMGKTLYANETEVLINKIITEKKDFERIRLRNSLKKDIPLWDMKYVYDPSFWKNYNILIDKPLDPTVKKDLEKEVPLNNQFIDAGVKNAINPK